MLKIFAFYSSLIFLMQVSNQTQVDNLTTISIVIGSIGTAIAGTIVVIVKYFLNYLKDQSELIHELKESQKQLQADNHDHLDRISNRFFDRQEKSQKAFQDQIYHLTEGQNKVLYDTVSAVKMLETALDSTKNDLMKDIQLILIKIKPVELKSIEESK